MLHFLHHHEIVWRRRQVEQELEAEVRRRVMERAADGPRERPTVAALTRLVRRFT